MWRISRSVLKDDNGDEFVTVAEIPKMFVTGESHCPVALFKSYLSKRPEGLKLSAPFYLACIEKPTTCNRRVVQEVPNG